MSWVPLLLSVVITITWGIAWFLTGRANKTMDPVRTTFLFQLLGIPFILPFAPLVHTGISFALSLQIFALGLFLGVEVMLLFYSQKKGSLSIVNPIVGTNSFIAVLLGILIFHEQVATSKSISIFLIFIGTILLSLDLKELFKSSKINLFDGVAPATLTAFIAGVGVFFSSFLSRQGNWFYTVVIVRSAVTLFTLAILISQRQKIKDIFGNIAWRFILPAAILDTAAYSLYNFATAQYEVSYIAAFVASNSLIGVVLAHIFLKERLSVFQYIGLPLVIGGLVFLNLK